MATNTATPSPSVPKPTNWINLENRRLIIVSHLRSDNSVHWGFPNPSRDKPRLRCRIESCSYLHSGKGLGASSRRRSQLGGSTARPTRIREDGRPPHGADRAGASHMFRWPP